MHGMQRLTCTYLPGRVVSLDALLTLEGGHVRGPTGVRAVRHLRPLVAVGEDDAVAVPLGHKVGRATLGREVEDGLVVVVHLALDLPELLAGGAGLANLLALLAVVAGDLNDSVAGAGPVSPHRCPDHLDLAEAVRVVGIVVVSREERGLPGLDGAGGGAGLAGTGDDGGGATEDAEHLPALEVERASVGGEGIGSSCQ